MCFVCGIVCGRVMGECMFCLWNSLCGGVRGRVCVLCVVLCVGD